MAHQIIWLPEALEDLEAITAFIARDSRAHAAGLVERVIDAVEMLATQPHAGRRLPELNREDVRDWPLGSYRILYQVRPTQLVVLAVIHAARQMPDEVLRRG